MRSDLFWHFRDIVPRQQSGPSPILGVFANRQLSPTMLPSEMCQYRRARPFKPGTVIAARIIGYPTPH